MERRRLSSYIVVGVVAVALIGWLTARYLVKRALIRDLGERNLQVRVEAARKLLAMKKLEDSLPAQPIIVRSKTAQALGEIRGEPLTPEAIRILGVIMRDQEEAPRRWARQALVKHGKQAVAVLMKCLSAGGATTDEAVTALQQIGPEAAPLVRFLLAERSSYAGASRSLAKMGDQAAHTLLMACYAVDGDLRVRALGDLAAAKSRAVLRPALDNLNPKMSIDAGIAALGELGDPVAVPAVLPYVADKDHRLPAVIALGLIGDGRAVEPILGTLTDPEPRYREQAIVALRRIVRKTGAPAYGPLLRELQSPNALMRQAAAAGLVGANSPQLNAPLAARALDPDNSVRASVARALGWEGNTAAIPTLVSLLRDSDWRVVEAAVQGLSDIGPRGIPQLAQVIAGASGSADRTLCYQIALAMAKMGYEAVPSLIRALGQPDTGVRTWVAVALGEIRDQRAVQPLRQLSRTASGDLKWVVEEQLRVLAGTA